jgi:hypothetical protein
MRVLKLCIHHCFLNPFLFRFINFFYEVRHIVFGWAGHSMREEAAEASQTRKKNHVPTQVFSNHHMQASDQ